MPAYQTTSPVLFLIFNRPDTTQKVFEQISEAKPAKLYIAADGPRRDREGEDLLCKETREIIKNINWPCELKTLFRDKNLGCKYGVSTALDWFFSNENEGIILEDDCLPSNDFFRFCDVLLEKYREDTRISSIAGCNFHSGKRWGDKSYYFSNNLEVWGWASWRRVWQHYDAELSEYQAEDVSEAFNTVFNEPIISAEYLEIFNQLKAGKIDTWDYQLKFITFFNNGLTIIPNVNLISNIGFRADATHTKTDNDQLADLPTEALSDPLSHPLYIIPNKEADLNILEFEFQLRQKKINNNKLSRKFKRWLKD
ncbi:nucleotide-diphospho-sugar transferase [Arcticibacter eurypsychrophilus]|uniref:nucleotide-diphospho-sugar transferase n=1 Tax=Arcticibacter eurypsychrophilus TaxID=1434752 RepID=UPI00084DA913|nr:nucleotide-diphospho-sugar transferase [Arcticibacter eurypsychrophilus]